MKKMLSLVLSMVMLLSMGTFIMHANEYAYETEKTRITVINETEYISPEEQLERYLSRDDLTEEQRQAAIDKYNLGKDLSSGKGRTRSVSLSENILNVMWFRQPNDYFCGPATIKQTMHYIEGVSDDMEEIADYLDTKSTSGTDTDTMCMYLNLYGNLYYEVRWDWGDLTANLTNMLISDTDNNLPIIGHIKVYAGSTGEWLYPTEGHYINYNGYSSNGSIFYITDPYADRAGDMDGKYTVSNVEANRVTTRIIW